MSRMRARIWTQRERWIMWLWALWSDGWDDLPDSSVTRFTKADLSAAIGGGDLKERAESIIRAKGTRRGHYSVPYAHASLLETLWRARRAREDRENGDIWHPSHSSPNILIRREL